MGRNALAVRGLILGGLLWACAADDPAEPGPPGPPLPTTPFTVSNPVTGPGGGSVAYLSLPPGNFAEGSTVTLHAPRAPSDTTLELVGGGFDPIPVRAAVGDTLTATVQAGPTAAGLTYRMLVPVTAAPTVVRTNPHDHQLRVGLDAMVEVIFSEPMDQSSLEGNLSLSRGGSPVPGQVVAAPPTQPERVRFAAVDSLMPSSTYLLGVTTGARDLSGDSLMAPYRADFTTDSAPTPQPRGPVITIVSPAAPDTQLADYTRARIRSISQDGHSAVMEFLVGASGDTLAGWVVIPNAAPATPDTLALRLDLPLSGAPGDYSLAFVATDTLGRTSAPAAVPLTLAAADSAPRLRILQFFLVEIGDAFSGGFGYAPQLVVADAEGAAGVEIIGFELSGFADFPYRFPPFFANQTFVSADSPASLFGEVYNDYEVYFSRWDGQRLTGPATARIAYRDRERRFHTWTFQGDVVARPDSLPPPAVCGRWEMPGAWEDTPSGCPGSIRVAAPWPGSGPGVVNGSAGTAQVLPLPIGRRQGSR